MIAKLKFLLWEITTTYRVLDWTQAVRDRAILSYLLIPFRNWVWDLSEFFED